VQFPHRSGQAGGLPKPGEDEGMPFDPKQVPEVRAYLAAKPAPPRHQPRRAGLAIVYAPGVAAIDGDGAIAAFVCDEWPEFVPDPFQTAGIGFHYDAPGARPPQSILLALPPQLDQDSWSFDDAVDVIHEAFDLARLRGVRPRDLAGGLGAVLPGNYLPHTYTDDLPSVRMLELAREARKRLVSSMGSAAATFTLGKI
jgi:hypothetical protein